MLSIMNVYRIKEVKQKYLFDEVEERLISVSIEKVNAMGESHACTR